MPRLSVKDDKPLEALFETGYTYTDNTVSGGTRYYYIVKSNDGAACTSPASNEVNALATGACTRRIWK